MHRLELSLDERELGPHGDDNLQEELREGDHVACKHGAVRCRAIPMGGRKWKFKPNSSAWACSRWRSLSPDLRARARVRAQT